jgi:predicted nucleic acid-binding protein
MMASAFLDSNILIYAFGKDPRTPVAEKLVLAGCAVSTQCLNEFASVGRRKMRMTWDEVESGLGQIVQLCPVIHPVDIETHHLGIRLAIRYGFSVYDGMIVAAALQCGCRTLWSEDMQDGMSFDGRLNIRNPFKQPISPG